MKRRRLIILLSAPLFVLGLVVLLAGWVLSAESGARWLMNRAVQSLEGKLSTGKVTGSVIHGLAITDFRFEEEGMELVIEQLETVVGFSLIPLHVNFRSLHADGFMIEMKRSETGADSAPVSVENILNGLKLPIAISMEDVVITGLEVLDVDGQELMTLDRISLSASWKEVIELRQLAIESALLTTNLQGHVVLNPPFEHQWQADGSMTTGVPTAGDAARLDFQLALEGVPDDYDLEAQAVLKATGLPVIDLELTGQGDMQSLKLDGLDANSEFLDARISGKVAWAGSGSVTLDMEVRRLELTSWVPDWPREHFIHGRLSFSLEDPGVHIRALSAKVAGSEMSLEGGGVINLAEEVIEGRLSWQKLGWPLDAEAYGLSSDNGQLLISGSPSDWRFEGDLDFDTLEYPGGNFALKGSGGADSAEIHIANGEALGGTLTGQAALDWRGALRWNAKLDVKQVDTSAFLSDWPARLDAKLELTQDTSDDSFELQLDSVHAELEGRSLDGSGGLVLKESHFRFKDVLLSSGGSRISLDGDLQDPAGLKFNLDVNKPGWLAEMLGGEVKGQGRVALQVPQPVLDIELEAHDLEWGENRVESVSITSGNTDQTASSADSLSLKLEAVNLELGDFGLQTIQAVIAGDRERQILDINLSAHGYALAVKLSGALSDWSSLADSDWSGQLTELTLASGEQMLLALQDAAPLSVAAGGVSLGRVCLAVAQSGGLCLESGWQADGRLDFAASLTAVPLNITELIADHQIEFTQKLDGDIQWSHRPGELPSGGAAIRISAGQFGDRQKEFDPVQTAEGLFGFNLVNGNLTAGDLDIPFPGVGGIDMDYAITGLALDGTGRVDGQARVDLNDISVLEQLLPGLEQLSGQLTTYLMVSGVVSDPLMEGSVLLQDGSADIPHLGTQLRHVRLQGNVNNNDRASLQGEFTAGEGQGEIRMETEFSDWMAPTMKMNFTGSSLRLLNTRDLRLNADADIQLGWTAGKWLIGGKVVMQEARIAPVTMVVSKATESEDLQLVAGTLPYGDPEEDMEPVSLTGSLEFSLGEKVKIDTDLAKIKLSGAVKLTWDDELIPIASGSIHGDGTLSVFGPMLHVKDGQVRFPDVPANEALLEIRAERDVFGNTQIRTAGVSITGPAKRPVIEAYTNPLTTKDRAWALLITGSDVDYGQGVGAFEVGAYIAPKIYLSYGISLFDDDNVVSARYDLKKGFGVKASSGQRESGIDMSYTIDR